MAAPKLPSFDQLLEVERNVLIAHQRDVERAIRESETRAKADAKQKILELAQAAGFELNDLFGNAPATKVRGAGRSKTDLPPKYRHPENADITWSGRGRQPDWVKAHIEAGGDKEELLIDKGE